MPIEHPETRHRYPLGMSIDKTQVDPVTVTLQREAAHEFALGMWKTSVAIPLPLSGPEAFDHPHPAKTLPRPNLRRQGHLLVPSKTGCNIEWRGNP